MLRRQVIVLQAAEQVTTVSSSWSAEALITAGIYITDPDSCPFSPVDPAAGHYGVQSETRISGPLFEPKILRTLEL